MKALAYHAARIREVLLDIQQAARDFRERCAANWLSVGSTRLQRWQDAGVAYGCVGDRRSWRWFGRFD